MGVGVGVGVRVGVLPTEESAPAGVLDRCCFEESLPDWSVALRL